MVAWVSASSSSPHTADISSDRSDGATGLMAAGSQPSARSFTSTSVMKLPEKMRSALAARSPFFEAVKRDDNVAPPTSASASSMTDLDTRSKKLAAFWPPPSSHVDAHQAAQMVMENVAAATLHVEAGFQRPTNNPTEPCGARCLVETAEQVEFGLLPCRLLANFHRAQNAVRQAKRLLQHHGRQIHAPDLMQPRRG